MSKKHYFHYIDTPLAYYRIHDKNFSSIYKEVDIELRSFISYDQYGESNGKYFRLLENNFILNTFEKVGEADKAFLNIVNIKINNGWIKIKESDFPNIA